MTPVEGCWIVLGGPVGLWRDGANYCFFCSGILGQFCEYDNLRKHIGTFGLRLVDKSAYQIAVSVVLAV